MADSTGRDIVVTFLNWIHTNQQDMTFGLMIAILVMRLIPLLRDEIDRFVSQRFSATLAGALLGTPLGVCANCGAPIAFGIYKQGARMEAALATMIRSPTLNVVVLSMAFTVFSVYIAKFDNHTRFHLGIFPQQAEMPIGFIAIFLELAGCTKTNTIIGNKQHWGEGVVLEVPGRALQFLFEGLQIHKVYGEVDGRNFASIYNYKAQGFTCEGVLREKLLAPDGARHDQLSFGLLREEWRTAHDKTQR